MARQDRVRIGNESADERAAGATLRAEEIEMRRPIERVAARAAAERDRRG